MMDDTNPFGSTSRPLPADPSPDPVEPAPIVPVEETLSLGTGGTSTPEASSALAKFHSCRWRATPDVGDFCTHRDVLPFAGKEGFVAESWCPECAFYKLRRTPKKREFSY